jgi:hypothetical protein
MIRLYLFIYLCKKFRPRDDNLYSILYIATRIFIAKQILFQLILKFCEYTFFKY